MFIITTPLPYTNDQAHLGHLLEGVFTDTIARFYRRFYVDQVNLTMGLDQHGLKIYQKALETGQAPEDFVAQTGQTFVDLWTQFEVRYDTFTPTESLHHKTVAQILWKRLEHSGFIYKKAYKGLYCVGCEDFYAPSQLTDDGKCTIHQSLPIELDEENYFFRLASFQDQITQYLQTAEIKPEYIKKEWLNFVKAGLSDISCSRQKDRLPWGVEVPNDADQVMYVWIEALMNYLTAAINPETIDRWIEHEIIRAETEPEIFAELLDNLPINIMYLSKEIAKFHLVIFIGLLAALGLPLPERALAHGLINDQNGHKFSKSLGNGVFPSELVDKIGVDGARFVMLHDINVDGDTNFDWTRILESYNSHLADNIGNLVMRVTTLVEKHLDGSVDLEDWQPTLSEFLPKKDLTNPDHKPTLPVNPEFAQTQTDKFGTPNPIQPAVVFDFSPAYLYLADLKPREALEVILQGGNFGNEIMEKTKPWTLAKEGKTAELTEILTGLCILLRDLGQILSIFLPVSGDKIYTIFNSPKISKAEVLFQKVEILKN